MNTKLPKKCNDCRTKYIIVWDNEKTELDPITCPFCGHEIDDQPYDDQNENEVEHEEDNDSWN
jgi:DNA-directed RNA polymerase subunit RPC12/RpoP